MAEYVSIFTKPYPKGYEELPSENTPVTAQIIELWESTLKSLEDYLSQNDIPSFSVDGLLNDGYSIGIIDLNGETYNLNIPKLVYESAITDGTKIGVITLGEQSFDVYAPTSSTGGSTVSVVPKTLTGTNIAEITVDGTTYQLYAPTGGSGSGSTVTAEAMLTDGTQIGKITIDGVETILYAPNGGGSITVDSELSTESENPVQNKVVTTELNKKIETLDDESKVPDAVNFDLDSELSLTSVKGVQNKAIAEEFQKYENGTKTVAKATEAETAKTAESATTAQSATTAESAIKATQDAQGNVIETTYARKTEVPQGAVVDDALSSTSTNPVQNKVVKAEFDEIDDSLSSLGKCKNLLNPTLDTTTQNGVTCMANGDGTYTLNGTATAKVVLYVNDANENIQNYVGKKLRLVGSPKGSGNTTYGVTAYIATKTGSAIYHNDYGEGKTFTVTDNMKSVRLYIEVWAGQRVDNFLFKPMLTTNLNATYDDFVPYTGDGDTLTADVAKVKSDLSDIKDGTTSVAKAVADEDGNNIKETYAKKTETVIVEDVEVEFNSELFSSNTYYCKCIGKMCFLYFNAVLKKSGSISHLTDLIKIKNSKYYAVVDRIADRLFIGAYGGSNNLNGNLVMGSQSAIRAQSDTSTVLETEIMWGSIQWMIK